MTAPSRWKQYLALVLLLLAVSWIVFDWARFKADFWPPDRSFIGPNLVASIVQACFLLIVLALIYPPTRHWIERAIESHARDLKDHVQEDNERVHAALQEKLQTLHDCLDHIIEHSPDIPTIHGTDIGPEKPPSDKS